MNDRLLSIVVVFGLALASTGCGESSADRRQEVYDLVSDPTDENLARVRELLEDPDAQVRVTALFALVSERVFDAERLAVDHLDDPDGFVRATAAKLVGDLKNPDHCAVLVERLLEDSDAVVRQRAAKALQQLGGPVAVEGLAAALEDPVASVRLEVARGVRELDPGAAKPALARLLLEDPEWEIRVQAARALGSCGDPAVMPILEQAAEDPNEFVRSAVANAIAAYRSSG